MEEIKILHCADMHVKLRDNDNSVSILSNFNEIKNKLIETKADIFVFAGDLFDFAIVNEIERKLAFIFLSEILQISTLKEFVFMCGNHDILSERKNYEILNGTNTFDSFNSFVETLAPEYSSKITYLKKQGYYNSKFSNKIGWISYSLEDGMSNGNNIDWENVDNNKYNISIFHDIIRDYIDETKLPVRKDKVKNLPYIDDFNTKLILAGDIHKNWTKIVNDKKFVYPGSTNQVNFGEKSLIKIRKNSQIFYADEKFLKLHTLKISDINNVEIITEDIELTKFLSYVEIDINSNKFVNNYIDDIKKLFTKKLIGKTKTIIKLRLSSTYAKFEVKILEELNQLINENLYPGSSYKIITTYDKFSVNKFDESILINDDSEDEEFNFNMDDLKLSNEKLINLFDKTLNKQIEIIKKNIDDEELTNEILDNIKSLFSEQIELSISAKPTYNILLNSIETTGFMGVEKNLINLDVPGLTKINGTNGIGKTTLFNMIRFTIDGVVFENLKSNQKKLNNLLVFNDKNINQDNIITRLICTINNTKISITRVVNRKWKNNVSDNDKSSINWKNYISEVKSTIKVIIFGKNEEKTYTGDEAEELIKVWFGDVTQTILILNQFKILNLLNLSSDKLQQLVLDYIGIDYLKLLEERLPYIKENYNLKKPDSNLEQLKKDFLDLINNKNNGSKILNKLNIELSEENNNLEILEKNLKKTNDELIQLGNIPNLIEKCNNELLINESLINSFVTKKLIEIPEWNKEKPEKYDSSILDKKINDNTNLLLNKHKQILLFQEEKESLQNNLISNLKLEKDEIPNKLKENFDNFINIYQNKINTSKQIIDNNYTELNNYFDDILLKLKNKLSEEQTKSNNLAFDKNQIKIKIDKIIDDLKSGVCSECGKPFGDDFEEHSKNLNKQKSLLEIEQTNISKLYLDQLNNNKKIEELITEYTNNHKFIKDKKLSGNFNDENFGKYSIICETIKYENIYNFDNNIFMELSKYNYKYFENHSIIELHNLFVEIKKLSELNILIDNKIENILKSDILKIEDIKLKECLKNINIINSDIEILNNLIETDKEIINSKNQNYLKLLEEYNNEFNGYTIKLNEINKENIEINNHNNSLVTLKSKQADLKLELSNYNLNLENYNKLIDSKNNDEIIISSLKIEIKNIQSKINGLQFELSELETNYMKIEESINKWHVYKRDLMIYQTYEKLIINDFPDIIFEYYRQYLNNVLNILLKDLNFKLYWDKTGDLFMVEIDSGYTTYRPVQLVSGMQTAFLGLSLIYTIHMLNVKNNISHIFIDELSGAFNTGKELIKKEDIINYQEQFVLLINKFTEKNIWIIDHNIQNMFETQTIEVVKGENGGKYLIL